MDTQTLKENFNSFIQIKSFSNEEINLREKSFGLFEFPKSSNEEWHYTPLKQINEQPVSEYSARNYIDQIERSKDNSIYEICFVNGCYIEKYSSFNNLDVKSLKLVEGNEKWFEALNAAFFENGVLITIKKNQIVEKPIVIRHYFNIHAKQYMASPRVLVNAQENSQSSITEIFEDGSDTNYFINDVIDFKLSKNSQINYLRLVNESKNSIHTGHIKATLSNDSKFNSIVVGLGSRLSRHQQRVLLNGAGAESNLCGIALLNEDRYEQNIDISHLAPHTTSSQDYKFILNGKSRGVFQGKVNIESVAQQSSAQQVNKNLLLDKKSHMDTKPQLDVYADDVKATHGATIGQIDANEKFYLQSRGLSPEEANKMLCEGFVLATVEKMKNDWQKQRILLWLRAQL